MRGTSDVETEFDELTNDDASSGDSKEWTVCEVLRSKDLWLPLTLVCSVQLASQLTVMKEVTYFTKDIFKNWQLNDYTVLLAFVAVSIVNVIVAGLAVCNLNDTREPYRH